MPDPATTVSYRTGCGGPSQGVLYFASTVQYDMKALACSWCGYSTVSACAGLPTCRYSTVQYSTPICTKYVLLDTARTGTSFYCAAVYFFHLVEYYPRTVLEYHKSMLDKLMKNIGQSFNLYLKRALQYFHTTT